MNTSVVKVLGSWGIDACRALARISLAGLVALVTSYAYSAPAEPDHGNAVVVGDVADLVSALAESKPGQRILVRAGTYELSEALHVPDHVALAGEGIMRFDPSGLPIGIEPAGRTLLRSTPGLVGDVITLGNRAALRNLVIEDFEGRSGNVVVISSRSPQDNVAALIDQCEIVNPNPAGVQLQGPSGRAVLVLTRNLNFGADPAPHDGSAVSLDMTHSLVHSARAGSGVFAINFASSSRVAVFLSRNVVGGGIEGIAGASRPDSVTDSSLTIESFENLYRSDSEFPSPRGWVLVGGIDAPVPRITAGATVGNRLRIVSLHDSIEGFVVGIFARAGERNTAVAGPISMNEVNISAEGLLLATTTTDLMLFGDRSLVQGMSAGDGNATRLVLRGARGSGARDNRYEDSSTLLGQENRLQVAGNPIAFSKSNQDVLPPPPDQFFTSSH